MEKLKAKHDHKLTDILKVAIFGLMLILPGLILLPSMLYYGVNEHATAATEQVEKIEYERVDFNQKWPGNARTISDGGLSYTYENNNLVVNGISTVVADEKLWLTNDLFTTNHIYIVRNIDNGPLFCVYSDLTNITDFRITYDQNYNYFGFINEVGSSYDNQVFRINIFDLTQMFGPGNEPTIEQFNSWYTDDYYEYTESKYEILEIPTGTYKTYTDITSQIQFNWNSLWQQPLFSWTNYTILKQGLDNFTYVFGITQTSYINNLITYELIMVAIYIVIDIVLTLFKWLTHLIGEK